MKIWCKIILVWAIVTTFYIIRPVVMSIVDEIRWMTVQKKSTAEQKQFLLEQIFKILEENPNISERRLMNKYYGKIVDLDPSDANNLNSYATSCMNLASIEKDSTTSRTLRTRSLWAAKQLRTIDPCNAQNLVNATTIYITNGYDASGSYFDTANVVLNRLTDLIKADSVEIPQNMRDDKDNWLNDLKETVRKWRQYITDAREYKIDKTSSKMKIFSHQ